MSCTLTHTTIAGMQAFYLENNLLKVGVLAGRGCDILSSNTSQKKLIFYYISLREYEIHKQISVK